MRNRTCIVNEMFCVPTSSSGDCDGELSQTEERNCIAFEGCGTYLNINLFLIALLLLLVIERVGCAFKSLLSVYLKPNYVLRYKNRIRCKLFRHAPPLPPLQQTAAAHPFFS